jgi:hypothetical protein
MTATPPTTCPACGAAASGKFCSNCGTPVGPRACNQCGAQLSAQARFCHRCGRPVAAGAGGAVAPGRGVAPATRAPWFVAAGIIAVAIGSIIYTVNREPGAAAPPPAPDMANAGQQSAAPFAGPDAAPGGPAPGGPAPGGPAPDISRMTPRERFDRLFNRIMSAAERGDSTTVVNFTPMALGAYGQLDSIDADARYHAAVLNTQVGSLAAAQALADTILQKDPNHLLGFVIHGTVAQLKGDRAAQDRAYRDFLAHYDTEIKQRKAEYLDHKPVLDEFRQQATQRR